MGDCKQPVETKEAPKEESWWPAGCKEATLEEPNSLQEGNWRRSSLRILERSGCVPFRADHQEFVSQELKM